eukprot:maker-scaffold1431_size41609-snap-gene-0.2 protein:Tk06865 transcript:maker-scaffold1431_size41609-snap-gene-0.2-mRNA-1 annotation:"peroxinectin "
MVVRSASSLVPDHWRYTPPTSKFSLGKVSSTQTERPPASMMSDMSLALDFNASSVFTRASTRTFEPALKSIPRFCFSVVLMNVLNASKTQLVVGGVSRSVGRGGFGSERGGGTLNTPANHLELLGAIAATASPRLAGDSSPASDDYKAAQVALNDVARTLIGVRRENHNSTPDLLRSAKLQSVDAMAVGAIAVEAWKAFRSSDGPGGRRTPLPFMHATCGTPTTLNYGLRRRCQLRRLHPSDVDRAQALRTREDGTMKVHDHWALPLLSVDGRQNAYTAGDVRALENPGLTALHTVWHKEHNRIAQELQDLFPFWVDEMLFQEARRLVVAQWQSVIFSQFATQLLGAQRVQNLKLDLTEPSVYDPSVDASIRNSFATAAYRFGHSLVHSLVKVSPMNGTNPREYPLKEHFFTTKLYESGGDEILLGLFHQASQPNDGYLVDDLRNHLFENIFGVQSDLFSRNIQRGRDHGLASYNDHRVFCNLTRPCNWEQKPPEITNADWQMLKLLYSDPDDIDLFVGGLLEEDSQGSILGPTFSCIIGRQFQMLKFGDRFFFTHLNAYPRSFLPHEMTEIRRRSLGDILCDNTNLTR